MSMHVTRTIAVTSGCALLPGIKERFGEDIHERLEQEGQVQIVWPNSSNPDIDSSFTWMLTKKVRTPKLLIPAVVL